jgi:hypothetical protein
MPSAQYIKWLTPVEPFVHRVPGIVSYHRMLYRKSNPPVVPPKCANTFYTYAEDRRLVNIAPFIAPKMERWLQEKTEGRYFLVMRNKNNILPGIYFEDENDAVYFALAWNTKQRHRREHR